MNPLFAGMLVALIMIVNVGPGLILYFQASISRGFIAGLAVLSGLWISDLGFLSLNYLGVSKLLATVNNQHIAASVSAGVLLVFGLTQWIMKPAAVSPSVASTPIRHKKGLLTGFFAGVLINSSNPFVFVFWMTLVGIASVNFGIKTQSFYLFFVGLLSCALVFDVSKCFVFSRINLQFNSAMLVWTNRVAGIALIAAAAGIVFKSFIL